MAIYEKQIRESIPVLFEDVKNDVETLVNLKKKPKKGGEGKPYSDSVYRCRLVQYHKMLVNHLKSTGKLQERKNDVQMVEQ